MLAARPRSSPSARRVRPASTSAATARSATAACLPQLPAPPPPPLRTAACSTTAAARYSCSSSAAAPPCTRSCHRRRRARERARVIELASAGSRRFRVTAPVDKTAFRARRVVGALEGGESVKFARFEVFLRKIFFAGLPPRTPLWRGGLPPHPPGPPERGNLKSVYTFRPHP